MPIARLVPAVMLLCLTLHARAQDAGLPPSAPAQSDTVIRAEKRLVLVDAVVTDKKGNYVRDLTVKDFRVWQDKKEVALESLSFEADRTSPDARKRYTVLFFDNAAMTSGEQVHARQAAMKFLDSNTGPNRLIAVVNSGANLQLAQNFTNDPQRLKQAVSALNISSVLPNGENTASASQRGQAAAHFGARSVLLGMRDLAKALAPIPGRKTFILLSAGFPLDPELRTEVDAVIRLCNKADIAVYSMAVPGVDSRNGALGRNGTGDAERRTAGITAPMDSPQNRAETLSPALPPNSSTNQEVLFALAAGTGGFMIADTNDLSGGLQKAGNEQNEYYVLGYPPPEDAQGECHELKVKVDRAGTTVRARTGYCTTKPVDLLAGTPTEKALETRAHAAAAGNVAAAMSLPFFYTSRNTARVDLALDIPPAALKFAKEKGKLHSEMNVLGIATEADGTIASRFSDTVKLDFEDKKQLQQFEQQPYHYENQFDLGSGRYMFTIVFSSGGESFGKLQAPLAIEPYDSKKFGLSGIALSKDIHKAPDLSLGLDAALLEDRKSLVSEGMELTPSGSNAFEKTHQAAAYLEIYEPLLVEANAPKIGLQMKIIDRKTGQQKLDTGFVNMGSYEKAGKVVVPVAVRLPVDTLSPGSYRAEFRAADSAGNFSVVRLADFEVQ